MRRSKKPKSVEILKTRRCVVRLQRMKTQPIKVTRSAATRGPAPLKKRPVTGAIISTPTSSMKAKERLKTPIIQRTTKIVQPKKPSSPAVEELPPTIAAGRSRRALKPNPKYASEDMVTPKNLKAVRKDTESDGKRRTSVSSLEDFFNKDTSEEDFDEDDEDTEDDKKFRMSKRNASDSDFIEAIDDSDTSDPPKRKPGRPRKYKVEVTNKRSTATNSSTSTILNKSAPATRTLPTLKNTPTARTLPTQLQQLRRTLGASTVSPLSLGRKRKLDESSGSLSLPVTGKRFILSAGTPKAIVSSNVATRKNSPSQAVNGGSKSSTPAQTQIQKRELISSTTQEKKTLLTKSTPNFLNSKNLSATKLQQIQQKGTAIVSLGAAAVLAKATATKAAQSTKPQSTPAFATSRTAQTLKSKTIENERERPSKKPEDTPKVAVIDDFETMPTFTIVNINDIINKKGDVLISKAAINKRVPGSTERRSTSSSTATSQQSKVLVSKPNPDRLKNSQFRTSTPLVRKSTEKMVNNAINKLIGRNVSASSTSSSVAGGSSVEKKPAPRILNSMVGRKTKPVKPMIANLDISEDSPSCSLSLYDDDDEDMDDDNKIGGSNTNETESLQVKKQIQSKIYNAAAATTKSKSSEPKMAAKENSLGATNILPQTQTTQSKPLDTRKLSPEKVIVSRQGDKIIKKITCFETWYVINVPADAPEVYERNCLDMPLIELANATTTINLPSELWTTKVTLYELSALSLAKSNVVTYTGDLTDQNIAEEDRFKHQPSCVMFRRIVTDRVKSQLPYDRAVIFKNKTFFTNIEGKNVKLIGAPATINQISEIETLLHIVDSLTLQSPLVEPAATVA